MSISQKHDDLGEHGFGMCECAISHANLKNIAIIITALIGDILLRIRIICEDTVQCAGQYSILPYAGFI